MELIRIFTVQELEIFLEYGSAGGIDNKVCPLTGFADLQKSEEDDRVYEIWKDWKENTVYRGYTEYDNVVQWFWKIFHKRASILM